MYVDHMLVTACLPSGEETEETWDSRLFQGLFFTKLQVRSFLLYVCMYKHSPPGYFRMTKFVVPVCDNRINTKKAA